MTEDKLCIITCDNFKGELKKINESGEFPDIKFETFPATCGHPPVKWNNLEKTVKNFSKFKRIEVVGSCCTGKLSNSECIRDECNINQFEQDFHMFAVPELIYNYTKQGAYIVTPGWVIRWQHWIKIWGFDQKTAREFFNEFSSKIVLLDTGINENITDPLKEFTSFINKPYEIIPVGLDHFKLYLSNINLKWQLENEEQKKDNILKESQKQISDYAMTMDIFQNLVATTSENEVIKNILNLCHLLFDPGKLFYVFTKDGIQQKIDSNGGVSQFKITKEFSLFFESNEKYKWLRSKIGFMLRIKKGDKFFGIIIIDNLSFPDFKEYYLNFALNIIDICALAIDNARSYQKIKDAEDEILRSHNLLIAKNTQLEKNNVELQYIYKKLKMSEEQFKSAFHTASHGMMLLSPEGEFVKVNNAFCNIVGYSEKELLRLKYHILTHKEDLNYTTKSFNKLLNNQIDSFQQEKRYIHKNGQEIWALASIAVIRDSNQKPLHFVGQIIDITIRKIAENNLFYSEFRLRQAILGAPFPMMLHAEDGEVLFISRIWSEITGYMPEDIPTIFAWAKKAYNEDLSIAKGVIADIYKITKKINEGEFIINTASGEKRIWEFSSSPLGKLPDGRRSIISMAVDVTERKSSEDSLKQFAETQAVLLKEVNHRVKNNLAAIIGLLYLEEERIEIDKNEEYGELLKNLLIKIKGLSTVHSLLSSSEWQPLNLSFLCKEIANGVIHGLSLSQSIELKISSSKIKVSSNQSHHFTLVLNELVTNTMKYAFNDKDQAKIEINISSKKNCIMVQYKDNGPGYPREFLIDDFSKANIGIELIQGIVKQSLGGTVEFFNDNGAGTIISFEKEK